MNNPFETIDARLSNIENLLLDLKHSNKENQPESDQLLTIQQAGELIKLSVPTLYGYVSRNEIPFSKKGKRLYFSKQELRGCVKPLVKKKLKYQKKRINNKNLTRIKFILAYIVKIAIGEVLKLVISHFLYK
jgi:excisionase family DNA binding protein